ncbi:MAG: hypothetical protein EXQ58_10770 [Acidobacteria bacterium]|nr:hypothetical protein [Acidobacteriota bacterium]
MIFKERGKKKGSEKIENRLLSGKNLAPERRSAQVGRALRARSRLWIQNRDASGWCRLNFFTVSGEGAS